MRVRLALSSQVIGPPRLIGHRVEEGGREEVGEVFAAGRHVCLELFASRKEAPGYFNINDIKAGFVIQWQFISFTYRKCSRSISSSSSENSAFLMDAMAVEDSTLRPMLERAIINLNIVALPYHLVERECLSDAYGT